MLLRLFWHQSAGSIIFQSREKCFRISMTTLDEILRKSTKNPKISRKIRSRLILEWFLDSKNSQVLIRNKNKQQPPNWIRTWKCRGPPLSLIFFIWNDQQLTVVYKSFAGSNLVKFFRSNRHCSLRASVSFFDTYIRNTVKF